MFKEVMQHNTIVGLPLLALVLFIVVFLAVVVMVLRRGKADPRHAYLAQLPLEDDAAGTADSPEGDARHGR